MSLTVCLAPANTVAYPNGGGHLWVYLNWALALKALGCRVIWLEGIDVDDSDTSPAGRRRRRGGRAVDCVATLKTRLEPYGLADTLALYAMNGAAVPEDVAEGSLDLDAAAGADLLLNLWHSAPAPDVPNRTPVPLELAVCLAEHYDEYRQLMEPKGWTLREAWDVSATPEAYRTYVQQSRGEFSCAKPAYVTLQTAWVSDRTLCYLASGKPAVVQHTGASRILPDGEGPHGGVVARRLEPAVGQRTRLVAERWLPALGLGAGCPRLLATAADGASAGIWHAFEDLGDETLASDPTPDRVAATVDLIAQL